MHNRIKALIVAAMVFTNTVSPTLEVLANEIEIEKASENIANTVSIEEETEENLALDIDESENADKEENTDEARKKFNVFLICMIPVPLIGFIFLLIGLRSFL